MRVVLCPHVCAWCRKGISLTYDGASCYWFPMHEQEYCSRRTLKKRTAKVLHSSITFMFINIEALLYKPHSSFPVTLSGFQRSFCQLRRNGWINHSWPCTDNDWKFGFPDFPRDWKNLQSQKGAWKTQENCF